MNLKERLQARYDRIRAEKLAKEEAERPYKERMKEIEDSPLRVKTFFWCNKCKKDVETIGHKQVTSVDTAWYVGFCPKGHKLLRYITDKKDDPYYSQSLFLKRQRFELLKDIVQPGHPMFKKLYPKMWEEIFGKKNDKKSTGN